MIKAEDKKAGVIMQKLEAKTRILFTEGTDPRVLHAAQKLIDKNILSHSLLESNPQKDYQLTFGTLIRNTKILNLSWK